MTEQNQREEQEAYWERMDAEQWDDDDESDYDCEPDESMDGDFDSAMASAGHGTDEDYGCYGEMEDDYWGGE